MKSNLSQKLNKLEEQCVLDHIQCHYVEKQYLVDTFIIIV